MGYLIYGIPLFREEGNVAGPAPKSHDQFQSYSSNYETGPLYRCQKGSYQLD